MQSLANVFNFYEGRRAQTYIGTQSKHPSQLINVQHVNEAHSQQGRVAAPRLSCLSLNIKNEGPNALNA